MASSNAQDDDQRRGNTTRSDRSDGRDSRAENFDFDPLLGRKKNAVGQFCLPLETRSLTNSFGFLL